MKVILIAAGLLFMSPAMATEPISVAKFNGWQGPKPAKPPCRCRSRDGQKVQLGAKMCMKRGDDLVTLQCRLVLNNTAWKKVEDGCVVAMN